MRKIIFTISALVMFNMAFAGNVDFSGAIGETKMPSDAEIMRSINRFNLTDEQKQQVFIITKHRLQQMYANEDVTQANEDLNSAVDAVNKGLMNSYMSETDRKSLNRDVNKLPSVKKGSVESD